MNVKKLDLSNFHYSCNTCSLYFIVWKSFYRMTMMLKVPKDKKNNSVQIKWVAIVECNAIPRFCKSKFLQKKEFVIHVKHKLLILTRNLSRSLAELYCFMNRQTYKCVSHISDHNVRISDHNDCFLVYEWVWNNMIYIIPITLLTCFLSTWNSIKMISENFFGVCFLAFLVYISASAICSTGISVSARPLDKWQMQLVVSFCSKWYIIGSEVGALAKEPALNIGITRHWQDKKLNERTLCETWKLLGLLRPLLFSTLIQCNTMLL